MSRRVTETCHSEVTDLLHLNTKPKHGTDWAIQSFVKLTQIHCTAITVTIKTPTSLGRSDTLQTNSINGSHITMDRMRLSL